MADNAKLEVKLRVSEATDYTNPYVESRIAAYTSTPDEAMQYRIECDTGGNVIDLGSFASVDYVVIKNLDGTNFITVQWDTAGDTDADMKIAANKVCILTDVAIAGDLTLTADTAAAECDVYIIGS